MVSKIQLISIRSNAEVPTELDVRSRFLVCQNRVEHVAYFFVGKRSDPLRLEVDVWRLLRRYIELDQNVLLAKNLTVFFWESGMAIEVRKLGGPMLAEVVGAETTRPLSIEDRTIVNQALIDHCVLVFRDQMLEPQQILDLSDAFGPVEPHITVKYRHPDYPDLIVMTNMDENGEISAHETARGVGWHTDMCYMPLPAKATLLHTIEIPEKGGDTIFANMYMAVDEMPTALREKIEGLRATFRYGGRATDRNTRLEKEDEDKPLQDHPMIKHHRESGRTSLFVNPTHTVGILGWEDDTAQELLAEVYKWGEQERFQARHEWRLGDTVIWDNRCCWHSATGENPLRQPRRFYRATIADRPHKSAP